jgi:WXG100 family type VII secretion target
MAGQITITPEQMRSSAGQYDNEAEEVGQMISRMDRMLADLQQEWRGAASEAYAARWNGDLKQSFKNAQQLITEIASSLRSTATQLESTDQQIAQGFNAR